MVQRNYLSKVPPKCSFFYCGVYLCPCGGDEHRDLKYSQFEFSLIDNPESTSENRPGSMHQVHLKNKNVVHYAKTVLGEKFFVYIMKKYMSKLPAKAIETDYFYCRPLPDLPGEGLPWY